MQLEEKELLREAFPEIDESMDNEPETHLIMEAPKENPISLKSSSMQILNKIASAESVDELREFTKLFHLSLAKQEASRALTQSELLDLVLVQAAERIRKRPDEMSNKDLLDYMNAFQTSLDKTTKTLDDKIDSVPSLSLTQNNQEININIGNGKTMSIDDKSRERILEVVNAITKGNRQMANDVPEEGNIIDADSNKEERDNA